MLHRILKLSESDARISARNSPWVFEWDKCFSRTDFFGKDGQRSWGDLSHLLGESSTNLLIWLRTVSQEDSKCYDISKEGEVHTVTGNTQRNVWFRTSPGQNSSISQPRVALMQSQHRLGIWHVQEGTLGHNYPFHWIKRVHPSCTILPVAAARKSMGKESFILFTTNIKCLIHNHRCCLDSWSFLSHTATHISLLFLYCFCFSLSPTAIPRVWNRGQMQSTPIPAFYITANHEN